MAAGIAKLLTPWMLVSLVCAQAEDCEGETCDAMSVLQLTHEQNKSAANASDAWGSPSPPPASWQRMGGANTACRGSGGNNAGYQYIVSTGVSSEAACMNMCTSNPSCQGVEYSTSGRCEVWTYAIGGTASAVGYTCTRLNRGGSSPSPPMKTFPGQNQYWNLVRSADVATVLPYAKSNSGLPSCMQGLVWMDQQCTTYWKLPWNYGCRTALGMIRVNEYLTGFSRWTGKCVSFSRNSWTFGQADISHDVCYYGDVTFCQTNQDTHGPCDEGAYFKITGGGNFDLERTSFGWDRITSPIGMGLFHYPLIPVVDGHGRKTEWFDDYLSEATQTSCPLSQLNCRQSQWAKEGLTARCLRSTQR